MLHRIAFSNVSSFADRQEISLRMGGHAKINNTSFWSKAVPGERLSKVIMVIGHNAAGKTNLLRPVAFAGDFIARSFTNPKIISRYPEPHFFNPSKPSHIEIDFELEHQRRFRLFRYIVRMKSKKVEYEALYMRTSGRFSCLFERTQIGRSNRFSIKQRGFGFLPSQASKVKPSVSLISAAAQYDVPLALTIVRAFDWIATDESSIWSPFFSIKGIAEVLITTDVYAGSKSLRSDMADLLRRWDLGLNDVQIERHERKEDNGKINRFNIALGVHRDGKRKVLIPFFAESSGTQSAFVQLARILPVLKKGGIVVVDQLEADLHPSMLEPILNLFFDSRKNPHNAQLIFSTHSLDVMNLLQKQQILLVEKDARSRSHAWKLSDIGGVRSDDNFLAKYMAGAYGAVPRI